MKKSLLLIVICIVTIGCRTRKLRTIAKDINSSLRGDLYDHQFTGFFVFDPETKDTLYKMNSEKYFTPASNTKIATLYAGVKTLSDHIPALRYSMVNDTLYMEGTGDPSFLHPYFKDSTALKKVSEHQWVRLHLNNFKDTHFAPGWAWEDYDTYFSPERSGFPMYGNVLEISNTNQLSVVPSFFRDSVTPDLSKRVRRAHKTNTFFYNRRRDTILVPMIMDVGTIENLWKDLAGDSVRLIDRMPDEDRQVMYSVASDSLYRRMMFESDNFLAEQLLMVISSTLSDTLSSKKARDHILTTHLRSMKHRPRWVDGSGLSRYNLFTPESMVYILNDLYLDVPRDRLFNLFPSERPDPYLFAKSGSLGNNYNLSGYLLTDSGKTLIFSFMNNHYLNRTSDVKASMYDILEILKEIY